jgi:hypothetical protein
LVFFCPSILKIDGLWFLERNLIMSSTTPERTANPPNGRPRKTEANVLNERLGKSLFAYTLAAGAGLMALSPEAMAKIIYTPAHISTVGTKFRFNIDLDGDGIPDLKLLRNTAASFYYLSVFLTGSGNQIIGKGHDAAALPSGAFIGPGAQFLPKANVLALGSVSGNFFGPWAYTRDRYLGLEFLIEGKVHFGWARLNVEFFGATLTGYAYETISNRPIQAGRTQSSDEVGAMIPHAPLPEGNALKPATLGLLAQGTPGLVAWRREEKQVSC